MSKVLFINGNLYGHLNPTLPVVAELVQRGEEVWYFCAKQFQDKIQASGAHFIDLGENLEQFLKEYKPTGAHPFYTLLEYIIKYDNAMIPELLCQINNLSFDYIIYDSILGAGYFLKEILHIPVICTNTSFVLSKLPVPDKILEYGSNPQLDEFYHTLEHVCQTWKVPVPNVYDFFINKGDLNLIFTSKQFNSDEESFDDTVQFVGPSIEERKDETNFPFDKIEGKKTIYISLGTINTDFNFFYEMCMKSLADLDYVVVMSVGKKCDISQWKDIPDNFIIKNFVPQLEILKKASLFISHGGFNSISEALYYGVPTIVIPMMNDQFITARRIVQLGAGISIKMEEIKNNVIRELILKIESDNQYRIASEKISQSFQQAGGYKRAVDLILKFIGEVVEHGNEK
jgi:glycosyltransferase, MGT family